MAAALAAIADALFNPDALNMPRLRRLPPPAHPGALAQLILDHTRETSVTHYDNAALSPRATTTTRLPSRMPTLWSPCTTTTRPPPHTRTRGLSQYLSALPLPPLVKRLSFRVTTLLSLRATTTMEHLSLRAITRLSLRATIPRPPPYTRMYWLSHCPATLPLPSLTKRLSLRVTTLLLFCATTR
jgi:hypothetical protein